MIMPPALRKIALSAHVACSVGSLGGVAAFFALAVAALASQNMAIVSAGYTAMDLIASYVVVPLVFASVLTGVIQSLGAPWGLFQHYWVVTKLVVMVFVTVILLQQLELINYLAAAAAAGTVLSPDLSDFRMSPVVHSGAGLLVLLLPVLLSLFKPRGMTRYGWRKQHERHEVS